MAGTHEPRSKGRIRPNRRMVLQAAAIGIASPFLLSASRSALAKQLDMPEYIPIELVPTTSPSSNPPNPPPLHAASSATLTKPPVYVKPSKFIKIWVRLEKGAPRNGYSIRLIFSREDPFDQSYLEKRVTFKKDAEWAHVTLRIQEIPGLVGDIPVEVTASGGERGTVEIEREVRVSKDTPDGDD